MFYNDFLYICWILVAWFVFTGLMSVNGDPVYYRCGIQGHFERGCRWPECFACSVSSSGSAACGPGKPLQQERHDWMWPSRCDLDSEPYPGEACQGTQAYHAGDDDEAGGAPLQGEVALWPHSTSPHGGPAWTCKVGRKLPSCLWEEGKERTTTYPCISDMQLTL